MTWMENMFQDPNSPTMEQLIMFNDHATMIMMSTMVMVTYMMTMTMTNKMKNRMMTENQKTETIWTMLPTMMLIIMGMSSIKTLYMMEEIKKPTMSIKTIGNQWFWKYEYSQKKKEMESYMKTEELMKKEFRLLETDNRMVMPFNTTTRINTTSKDVIHSWTIPSMGIKMDSIPGRINQMLTMIKRPSIMFGQCSEICGTNHTFMPIMLESVKNKKFMEWLKKI